MNSDMIKEFLVGLGFKVDTQGLKLFTSTIDGATKAAAALGIASVAAATATIAAVSEVSEKFEDMYYASQRIKASVGNIQSFDFAIGQVGGTAEGALGSLEGLASFMRSNPGGEKFIQSMGVSTRDANNNLRDTTKIMEDLGAKFRTMPFYRQKVYANILGIDEKTLMAMDRGIGAFANKYNDLYAKAGINADQAAKNAKNFMNALRDLGAHAGVVADVFAIRLVPAAKGFIWAAQKILDLLGWLDQHTEGWSSRLIALATIFVAVNKGLSLIGINLSWITVTLIPRLLLFLATLTETALPALSEAFFGLAVAMEATPIGWIITGIAALGIAGYELWKHWKDIGPFFGRLWNDVAGFFERGWNRIKPYVQAMAKALRGDWKGALAAVGGAVVGGVLGGPVGAVVGGAAGAVIGTALGGKGNGAQAMAYFQKMGWTAAQAAGLVANIGAESGFKPGATGDGGTAFGIAQWHRDRQNAFKKWSGHDIHQSTFQEQLGFINYELTQGTERMAGRILRATKDAFGAGAAVSRYYERPANAGGEALARGAGAGAWYAATLGGSGGKTVTVNATVKSDIHVHGSSSPEATAGAVRKEQSRVNGDALRNLKGAVS